MNISAHCLPQRPDRIARKALEALALDPQQHRLLEENLASYTSHLHDDYQQSLETLEGGDLLARLQNGWAHGEHRWTDKLRRDLRDPYSDQQVGERFEALKARFIEEARNYPGQLFIAGSLSKGRFGAHSDLDVLATASPGSMPASSWQTGSPQFLLDSFPGAVAVGSDGQDLLKLWREGLGRKGLELHDDWKVARHTYVQRQPEPIPKSGMMWSFADLP